MIDWTNKRIAQLSKLWGDGLSILEMSKRMNISKNAVVGKVHRLNLPPRPSPIKRGDGAAPKGQNLEKRRKSTSPAQPVNKALLAVMCEADLPNVVQMVRKVGDKPCAWPMGDPRLPGFHFCNDLALDGKPYCQAHGQIAFVRPGNNRKDAA